MTDKALSHGLDAQMPQPPYDPVVPPESLDGILDSLHQRCATLQEAVDELSRALDPFLVPAPEDESIGVGPVPVSPQHRSHVVQTLLIHRRDLDRLAQRINDITGQVER